jgi:YD repeat-containing protein
LRRSANGLTIGVKVIDKQGAEASNGQERVIAKSYGYDAAGRTTSVVTSAGTTSLTYDYEGRITGITYPSSATNSFTYNGLDTRVGKVDSSGTATYKRDGAGVTAHVLCFG